MYRRSKNGDQGSAQIFRFGARHSDLADRPTEGHPFAQQTCGRTVQRDRETRAEQAQRRTGD
jgi:hypothetical protein